MLEFSKLLKGDISPLKFRWSREDVQEVFEKPDGEYRHDRELICKYGAFQLYFLDEMFVKIVWTLLGGSDETVDKITGSKITHETSLAEFLDICEEHHLSWCIDSLQSFDRQICIHIGDNVFVYFDLEPRELQKIVVSLVE